MQGLKETKYRFDKRTFKELKSILQVPKFQRGAVWSDKTKAEFIKTALNGFPFGALLLYEENIQNYSLIDGLQRFSTLLDYERYPYKYIIGAIRETLEDFVDGKARVKDKTILLQQLLRGFEQHFVLTDNKPTSQIARAITGFVGNDQVEALEIADLVDRIRTKFSINNLPIACMVYEGQYSDLPMIFKNINSHGMPLNKYDIYAATWSHFENTVRDNQILTTIDNKYDAMSNDTNVQINGYEKGAIIKSQSINLYEYCFAIGELVSQACPYMVSNSIKSKTDINPIGFKLVSLIIGSTSSPRDDRLLECFKNASADNLANFKNCVIECAKEVETRFSKYFLSLDGQKFYYNYNENQISSLIVTLFRIKYITTSNPFELLERGNNKGNLENFNKHAHFRIMFDVLSKYWSNSAEDKLNGCFRETLPRNIYLTNIETGTWRNMLQNWMQEQQRNPRVNQARVNEVYYNFIYRLQGNSISFPDRTSYGLVHIIAPDLIKKKCVNVTGVSALGNVCLLPKLNTSTTISRPTLYDQLDNARYTEEELKLYLYPERKDVDFVRHDASFGTREYMRFLRNRHAYLEDLFVNLVDKAKRSDN